MVTAVHYRKGRWCSKGDPLIEIDPRPYQATLLQAQGVLERDQSVLAQAQMDLRALPGGLGAECDPEADAGRSGEDGAAGRRAR